MYSAAGTYKSNASGLAKVCLTDILVEFSKLQLHTALDLHTHHAD